MFPWREDQPSLQSKFVLWKQQTTTLVAKLKQTPDLLKLYSKIVCEQEQHGLIECVWDAAITGNVHSLPHRIVEKDSSTTPIRILYDCSCRANKFFAGLNDFLMVCPPFLNDLYEIILRFRNHPIAFATNIEKAFLRVILYQPDRNFTWVFWLSNLKDPDSNFLTYHFAVVPFGSASSPFTLNAVLILHLTNDNSTIANNIINNIYVDNVLSGFDVEEQAVQHYTKARNIMNKANFNLRSWAGNSHQLQEKATKDKVLTQTPSSACWASCGKQQPVPCHSLQRSCNVPLHSPRGKCSRVLLKSMAPRLGTSSYR